MTECESNPAPDGRSDDVICPDCGGVDFAICPDCGSVFCDTCLSCHCLPDEMPDHGGHRYIDLGDGAYAHANMAADASPETVAAVTELARAALAKMRATPEEPTT